MKIAPVVKYKTLRLLLAMTTVYDLELEQMDVKTTFLHGDLDETIYMRQPKGFIDYVHPNHACLLNKSIYGLKQSPRAWFERFTRAVKGFGYKQCLADHTLFVKHSNHKLTIIIVYVDDIVVTGNNPDEIVKLKKDLAQEFEVKDLGPLRYFLGLEFARTSEGISVSQRKYTLDLLKET